MWKDSYEELNERLRPNGWEGRREQLKNIRNMLRESTDFETRRELEEIERELNDE